MGANLYFIGGGNMPSAIIEAVRRKAAAYPVDHIWVEEISRERAEYLASTYNTETASPTDAPDADIVVIAVRPQDDVAGVAASVARRFDPAKTTVISIVAGYTIAKLEQGLGHGWRVARIIPNTLTTVDYVGVDEMVDDVRRVKTGDYVDKSFLDIQHFAESVEERIHVLACRGPIQRHAAVTA